MQGFTKRDDALKASDQFIGKLPWDDPSSILLPGIVAGIDLVNTQCIDCKICIDGR